jgi:hypothetical protein
MSTESVSADSASAAMGNPDPATSRRLKLTQWIVPVLTSAALAAAISWTASFPGPPFAGLGLIILLGIVAVPLWMISTFAWRMKATHRLAAVIVSVVLLASSVGLTVAGMPLRIRFAASQAAFEAVVAKADAAPRPPFGHLQSFPIRCPTSIGQFRISGCGFGPDGGYTFFQSWNAVTDDSGIAYLPNGPTGWGHHTRQLVGPWYGWS